MTSEREGRGMTDQPQRCECEQLPCQCPEWAAWCRLLDFPSDISEEDGHQYRYLGRPMYHAGQAEGARLLATAALKIMNSGVDGVEMELRALMVDALREPGEGD